MTKRYLEAQITAEELQSVLGDAMGMGALMSSDAASVGHPSGSIHLETFESALPSNHEEIVEIADSQVAELARAFGPSCPEPVYSLLWLCVEAAWVLGAHKASGNLPPVTPTETWRRLHPESCAERWEQQLTRELIHDLRELGWILEADPEVEAAVWEPGPGVIWVRSPSGEPEIRTTWIAGAREGRAYQWCVSRDEEGIRIARRLQGNRERDPSFHVSGADAGVLAAMIRRLEQSPRDGSDLNPARPLPLFDDPEPGPLRDFRPGEKGER